MHNRAFAPYNLDTYLKISCNYPHNIRRDRFTGISFLGINRLALLFIATLLLTCREGVLTGTNNGIIGIIRYPDRSDAMHSKGLHTQQTLQYTHRYSRSEVIGVSGDQERDGQ